ncbi:MAG TPA: tetratricopeptide repeat protein [Candidatus Limnocylindrales bacterium]|nr:tetratricopeptide repeat protein [Candidatus Limnocylindrales bacterium]
MTDLPRGTVTLVFTDIEGSTRLLQSLGDRYAELLSTHNALLHETFAQHGGTIVDTAGDGLYATFPTAHAAVAGAVAAQRAIVEAAWPEGAAVRVRMGIHTGEPLSAREGYVGLDVHRAARISAAAHGGQVIISQATRELASGHLPAGVSLLDLGEHQLKDLVGRERLFQVVADGLPRDFPALRSLSAAPNNLPRQLTGFVGRAEELADIQATLASAPLVTLTGPGGVGKTRLGVEVATAALPDFADGAWLVDLAALTDPALVEQVVASTLGVIEQPGRTMLEALTDHVRQRRLLVLLDNCEHVLSGSAELASSLLQACPEVRILATSREPLGVPGEASYPLRSLSLPDRDMPPGAAIIERSEAARLFAERAAAVLPSFRVTAANAPAVAQICWRLDGIPLALELAAARVRSLAVEQIAARLDDRFRLLTGSSRLTVPRHQTLRATIDWSFQLLDEYERTVARRLSVFAGGFTLEAAEAICPGGEVVADDVLDLLSRLVEKSLVTVEPAAETRYRLLETIRQYMRDRLLEAGEAAATQRRHRDWYLALADTAAPNFFRGPESAVWLDRLEAEHDNLRAALQWSEDEPGEGVGGLRLAASLWRFWEIRGHLVEGRSWLERLLRAAAGDAAPQLRADALTGAGVLAAMQADHDAAVAFHEQVLELRRESNDPNAIAYAINNLANAALAQGDLGRAAQLYNAALLMGREMGDRHSVAFSLSNMADVLARMGDRDGARERFDESVALFRALGDRWGEAAALDSFALAAGREGDPATSAELHGAALAIWREIGDERGVARSLTHLADLASATGDTIRARALYRESLAIRERLRDLPGTAAALEGLASTVMADDAEAAARLVGAAEAVRERIRAPMPVAARVAYEARMRDLEQRLGGAGLQAARAAGRAMGPAEAVATSPP